MASRRGGKPPQRPVGGYPPPLVRRVAAGPLQEKEEVLSRRRCRHRRDLPEQDETAQHACGDPRLRVPVRPEPMVCGAAHHRREPLFRELRTKRLWNGVPERAALALGIGPQLDGGSACRQRHRARLAFARRARRPECGSRERLERLDDSLHGFGKRVAPKRQERVCGRAAEHRSVPPSHASIPGPVGSDARSCEQVWDPAIVARPAGSLHRGSPSRRG